MFIFVTNSSLLCDMVLPSNFPTPDVGEAKWKHVWNGIYIGKYTLWSTIFKQTVHYFSTWSHKDLLPSINENTFPMASIELQKFSSQKWRKRFQLLWYILEGYIFIWHIMADVLSETTTKLDKPVPSQYLSNSKSTEITALRRQCFLQSKPSKPNQAYWTNPTKLNLPN